MWQTSFYLCCTDLADVKLHKGAVLSKDIGNQKVKDK